MADVSFVGWLGHHYKHLREKALPAGWAHHERVCMLAAVGVFTGEDRREENMLLNYDGHITIYRPLQQVR
jgi:hypothetical protein